MPPIKGILFDKDGTLFDFTATWGNWAHDVLMELAEGRVEGAVRLGAAIGYVFPQSGQPGFFLPHSPVIASTSSVVAARDARSFYCPLNV